MKDASRWLILLVALVLSTGVIYYEYQNTRPCRHPVGFALGAIDKRFEISNAALVENARASAAIWNDAAGKTVLAYEPQASLKINLIYDEREATAKLGSQIAREQEEIDAARAALDTLRARYEIEQAAYVREVAAVNARLPVGKAGGGAKKQEAAALKAKQAALSALSDTINAKVAEYNARVRVINAKVAEYNQFAGQTFREGEYVSDARGVRINIFEFIGATQLKRVLAHEFGHAIGLGHNEDANAIMYAENESGNLVPTAADLSALRALCGS
ncbi:matrixin family metalloprotease [Candidatus Kaiserbacteria bacterium]|nr:matrixin family metalloprotease [Candidatus Kaiserbacteria bacterium]